MEFYANLGKVMGPNMFGDALGDPSQNRLVQSGGPVLPTAVSSVVHVAIGAVEVAFAVHLEHELPEGHLRQTLGPQSRDI
jgi:uncharacterized membrane-anchored protein